MKRLATTLVTLLTVICGMAQGWPANYGGVMLQGFYWDSYDDTRWSTLTSQADELSQYFDLIWVPNSGQVKADEWNTEGNNRDMGYMPCFWFKHNTCFGTQEDLKTMISTFKANGTGIIEDVVINHKNGEKSWCDFPNETYTNPETGKTYTLNWTLADICYNDNGGYVKAQGYDVTGAADTGDDFDGCRDLDHTGANVQQNVITYLDFLQDELGYSGFRYDMVKGYGPQYVGIYNSRVKPTFSVGEYWDNWDGVTYWVNGTSQNGAIQSAAFDFPLKFLINDAFNGSFKASALSTQGMAGATDYQRYAVTFVDNHDTYRDGNKMSNDNHVLAANAFILAMPGTPCIFLPHWKAHKESLKKMIAARKAAGITNQSSVVREDANGGCVFKVTGTNGTILVTLGYVQNYDTSGFNVVVAGDDDNNDFCFYVSDNVTVDYENIPKANENLGTPVVDMASGTYYQSVTVTVSPSDEFTTLVYTTDGSDPTLNSAAITSSQQLEFTATTTLKVGVKGKNAVTDVQTYKYVITDTEPADITIYVRADKEPIYLYAWDASGTLTASWPGTQLSAKKSVGGVNFYYMTFDKVSADYSLNYILSQGSDDTKTPDNTGITTDVFTALGKGTAVDLTATYAGLSIEEAVEEPEAITVYVKGTFGPAYLYAWNSGGNLLGAYPGTKMSTTLINGHTWFYYTMPKNVNEFNMIVNEGQNKPQSNDFTNVTSTIYVEFSGNNQTDLTTVSGMEGYPTQDWYEQGEVCAFFVDNSADWGEVHAWVWNTENYTGGNWPGQVCTLLGYNEDGQKIWKWNYLGTGSLPDGTKIIFNNNNGIQTCDCNFVNGQWYNSETNKKDGGSVDPANQLSSEPSSDISVAALGTDVVATNWNGKQEHIAQCSNTQTITKPLALAAGNYTVQAIVRGTNGGVLTLSAKGQSDEVTLKGMDGATSTVSVNGSVEPYITGANNGWHKAEVTITLSTAESVTVTISSTASQWQLGELKVLPGTTATIAALDETTKEYDATAQTDFSFFERGENRNVLIQANSGQPAALLSYNVIIDGTCQSLLLADGNYSFGTTEAFTATAASYDRTFVPGTKSTVCLPFSLTAEEAQAAGSFYQLDGYDAATGTVHFAEVAKPQAYTAYLFMPATEQPFLSLGQKRISTTSLVPTEKDGLTFQGVMDRTHLVSVDNGTTYYGYSTSGEFVRVGTTQGAYLNPFRASLVTAEPLPARLKTVFGGDPSGISELTTSDGTVQPQSAVICNLQGQRVAAPRHGLYIVGGKKCYVK